MKLSDKTGKVQEELINALCNITDMPESVLPHLVFVEEEDDKGEPTYNKYSLIRIIPEHKSCILSIPHSGKANEEERKEEEFSLSTINIDWLEVIWKRYLECAHIVEKEEQQLYAFVWHFEHMGHNVPDEEILRAWKLQDHNEYRVEKFTLDAFAEYLNGERFNDLENYVRFILTT